MMDEESQEQAFACVQVASRRELERQIHQAVREQRVSERRFRMAWHEYAGRKTWWQRWAWELGLWGWSE
jgi:hypothetical protein